MNKNLTAFILIVLAGGIYYTVTRGLIAEAKAVKTVNDQYAAALDNADALIKIRDGVDEQYKMITLEDQDRLDKMIPSSVDNIRLIIDLNSKAQQRGFALSDVKASASDNGAATPQANRAAINNQTSISIPTLDTVKVTFGATAPYNQFVSFLQDLESNLRVMEVKGLSVTVTEDGLYAFRVELETYWIRQ